MFLLLKRIRLSGSFDNPGGANEERQVKPFPTQIHFRHKGYRKKFEQMMNKKIVPNKYASASSLSEIGLLDKVMINVNRMGWGDFVMMQSPTYTKPTCEFLSIFSYDEQTLMLKFQLGNEEHNLGLFDLNDVFHFPMN